MGYNKYKGFCVYQFFGDGKRQGNAIDIRCPKVMLQYHKSDELHMEPTNHALTLTSYPPTLFQARQ